MNRVSDHLYYYVSIGYRSGPFNSDLTLNLYYDKYIQRWSRSLYRNLFKLGVLPGNMPGEFDTVSVIICAGRNFRENIAKAFYARVIFTILLYIYCPVWRETRRFVPPRKFMSPEGFMNFLGGTNLRVSRLTGQLIVYYTESCSTTLYSAERCVVRHDRETQRLEGNTMICSPSTWLLTTNHISLFVILIIWGIIMLFFHKVIWVLFSIGGKFRQEDG